MILYHCFDDTEHQCILVLVLRVVNIWLFKLGAIIDHELKHVSELLCFSDRVLDEVFVDWDALDNVNDTFNVELACKDIGGDGCILARWQLLMYFLYGQVFLYE